MPELPCSTAVEEIPGTGFNTYPSPETFGQKFKSFNAQLLYEILQELKLLVAATPPAMTKIVSFKIGDGQAGTPANGDTFLELPIIQGQTLVNVNLLVIREGIELVYSSAVTVNQIRRYNHAGNGGFVFEAASGLSFATGERYDLYVVGSNTTDQV